MHRRRLPRWQVRVAAHVLDRRLLIEPQVLEVSGADERDARAEATRAVHAVAGLPENVELLRRTYRRTVAEPLAEAA